MPASDNRPESRTRWTVIDVLRLEALIYRHEVRLAEGARREENAANQAIIAEAGHVASDRRALLKQWADAKWATAFAGDPAAEATTIVQEVPRLLIGFCFLLGAFVNWLIGFAGSDSVDAIGIFLTHAALPLASLLLFLTLGRLGKLRLGTSLLRSRLRRQNERLQQSWSDGLKRESKRATHQAQTSGGFLRGFAWLYAKLATLLVRIHATSENVASPDLTARDAFAQALCRRNPILQQWLAMQFQRILVAYLVGFCGMLMVQLAASGTAFYWSTTFGSIFDAARMEQILRVISLPWGFAFGPPTEAEVAATQRWPGDSIQSTELLRSAWEAWAWFLVCSIAVYAILPRLLLSTLQGWNLRRCLRTESFHELRFDKLIDGMTAQTGLKTQAPATSETQPPRSGGDPTPVRIANATRHRCLVIADEEWFDATRPTRIESALTSQLGIRPCETLKTLPLNSEAMSSDDFQQRVASTLGDWMPLRSDDRVLHLLGSGALPKSTYKTRADRIRTVAGAQAGILFVLIDPIAPPSAEAPSPETQTWLRATRSWNDPNLDVAEIHLNGGAR